MLFAGACAYLIKKNIIHKNLDARVLRVYCSFKEDNMELNYNEFLVKISDSLEVEEDISLETLEELMNGKGEEKDE